MRCMKMLAAAALAAAALAVVAGSAAATALTQAPPYTGTVKAESEGEVRTDGSTVISCQKSMLEWSVESHGTAVTTSGPLTGFTLEECGKDTVTVLDRGRFELHATSNGNGTMTWDGAEITVQLHRTVIFPHINVTTHCIYVTEDTHIGTFTGSRNTGGTATFETSSSVIPQIETESACGNDTVLTGSYKFTSPDYLDVD